MTGEQLELAIPSCLWCGNPATHACDAPIARGTGTIKKGKLKLEFPLIHSCDLPMCAGHARKVGHMHLRFSGRRDGKRSAFETIDHCPYHARLMIPAPLEVITTDQAQALRDQIARGIFLDRDVGIYEPKT
jgi:hypothetical protein